ncbi:hypothetical protein EO95_09420 [Methanosarcina sp. 1.H.T.1A.1]|nr:hypothetical protein EO95_09420 [Methanosarcina sp. 1.H.T.1A.1]
MEFKSFFSYKDYIKEYKPMATSFARLRYRRVATIKDLDEGKNYWANSIIQSKTESGKNIDKLYKSLSHNSKLIF